jgi:flagellar protein FlbD
MIQLTRLNHVPLVLNSDLIEHIEVTPDTVIMLTDGQIIRVLESADEVVARVIEFRRAIFRNLIRCPVSSGSSEQQEADGSASERGSWPTNKT